MDRIFDMDEIQIFEAKEKQTALHYYSNVLTTERKWDHRSCIYVESWINITEIYTNNKYEQIIPKLVTN